MTTTHPDFGAVRDQARFETVLANYGLKARGQGAERMILCPFHDDRSPSCSINLDRKVFHCFACGAGGSILDFLARMESCSIADAARLLTGWCAQSDASPASPGAQRLRSERVSGNEPLKFVLDLDPGHPYLTERGVSQATISRFGLGYCDRGVMKGRICIPIHDEHGRLVAYAGRWPGSPPPGEPRYRFPRGFRKRLVLFNFHRVKDATDLVIVEGFWSVFRLDALGVAAVALMGCSMSTEQEDLMRRSDSDRMILLLDGDAAGRAASVEILPRLARHGIVHVPVLPEGLELDTIDEVALLEAARPNALL